MPGTKKMGERLITQGTLMYLKLLNYYLEQRRWAKLSVEEVRKRQTKKFRHLFEYAREHSPFYREVYREAGVEALNIRVFEDIQNVPIVNKEMMRAHESSSILTCPVTDRLNLHVTSGSTGIPFKVYQNKFEDYTAHFRVLHLLRSLGYQPWHKITMITRYEPDDQFQIEKDLSVVSRIQKYTGLFQREILSIYDEPEKIIEKVEMSRPYILWSTPSVLDLVANVLLARGTALDIPYVVLTSETIQPHQYEKFHRCISKNIVSHYGLMEAPTAGYRLNGGDYRILCNAVIMECVDVREHDGVRVGTPIITNLVNHTMPFIRYNTNDVVRVLDLDDFPQKVMGPIEGRMDDILDFPDGSQFVHHHAAEMFMSFEESEQYQFVQKTGEPLRLLLVANPKYERSMIEAKARERWNRRFARFPIDIHFVDSLKPDSKTGKQKNIKRQGP